MYSMAVAGFVMLGASWSSDSARPRLRTVVLLFGVAQILMTFSPAATMIFVAQGLAGAGRGGDRAGASGAHRRELQRPAAGHGGRRLRLGTRRRRRRGLPHPQRARQLHRLAPVFGILIGVSALVFFLSFRLKPDQARPEGGIDLVGVDARGGVDHPDQFRLQRPRPLGLILAPAQRPFDLLGLSPAPVMIVCRHRAAANPSSLDARRRRAEQDPAARLPGHRLRAGAGDDHGDLQPSWRSRRC